MKVEFHVPISPTRDFLIYVHILAASLEANSGLHSSEYRLIVTVGADEQEDLTARCPWSRRYPMEWRWIDRELFRRESYYANGAERLRWRFEADSVVLLDADVVVAGSLRDWVEDIPRRGAIQALPALYSPFFYAPFRTLHPERTHREWWNQIFREAGLAPPRFTMEHRGWGILHPENRDEEWRYSPYYFNLGVVGAPPEILNRIGATVYEENAVAARVAHSVFDGQIGFALAVARQGLPIHPLPLSFNFPTITELAAARPEELEHARILHYLQPPEIDKKQDFQSYGHVESMTLRRGLSPVNQAVATTIGRLYEERILPDLAESGMATPERPPVDRLELERAVADARRYVDAGQFDEAHDRLANVLPHTRKNPSAHYLMAFALQSLGRTPDAALAHYHEALDAGFAPFWVHYNRGLLYLTMGDRPRASADLKAAAALDPGHPGVQTVLGQLPED
jgi:hypothetical protein